MTPEPQTLTLQGQGLQNKWAAKYYTVGLWQWLFHSPQEGIFPDKGAWKVHTFGAFIHVNTSLLPHTSFYLTQ